MGLDLIFPVVGGKQMETTLLAAPVAEQPVARTAGRLLYRVSRVWEVMIELRKCNAGILFLIGAGERHAELQEIIGRLRSFRVAPIPLGKGTSRFGVSLALVISLAEPILGAAGQRIFR